MGDGGSNAGYVSFLVFQLRHSSFGLVFLYVLIYALVYVLMMLVYIHRYMDVNTTISNVIKLE